MQHENQRAAREFFGYKNQMGVAGKLDEEIGEIIDAHDNYLENPTLDNLRRLMLELKDAYNVCIGEWVYNGMEEAEISVEGEYKADRTIEIINQIAPNVKCKVKEYNKIRYGGKYVR